jgi:tetratricopeptide (TPR) repeat protein
MVVIVLPLAMFAQEERGLEEEESAAVFLEEYSDTFQEQFFEGLKQKGIENYDRAINAFLVCKQMEPNNNAVAYELAKAYLEDKQYQPALEFAIEAINSEPENYWYLENLYVILEAQGNNMAMIAERIPYENTVLKSHLAQIYFKAKKYEESLAMLKGLKKDVALGHLEDRVKDSLASKSSSLKGLLENANGKTGLALSPVEELKAELGRLMDASQTTALLARSEEAMESYPLQPFFYYAHGYALNGLERYAEAVELLETSLDYLVNDVPLSNNIYRALAKAYTGLSKPAKANEYLSKIKQGF